MQTNAAAVKKKKPARKMVHKPYQKGTPTGGKLKRRALKVFGLMVAIALIYLVVGSVLTFGNAFLRCAVNVLLLLAGMMLLYSAGLQEGDSDVAFSEIVYQRIQSGKKADEEDIRRCYHPLKGLVIALLGISPLLLIAIVFAFLARKQVYVLQTLPSWVGAYENVDGIGQALSYYSRPSSLQAVDVLRIIVRVFTLPYINIVTTDNTTAMYVIDKLSPLVILLPALFYWVGYVRGALSRALVHGSIASNNRRRSRMAKRRQRERQQKNRQIV